MAKGRMPAMGGMGGMNMNAMLRQAQKMQENMEKTRLELDAREYEFSAGGGAVNAKVNGKKELLALDIKPEVIDPEDAEMLPLALKHLNQLYIPHHMPHPHLPHILCKLFLSVPPYIFLPNHLLGKYRFYHLLQ